MNNRLNVQLNYSMISGMTNHFHKLIVLQLLVNIEEVFSIDIIEYFLAIGNVLKAMPMTPIHERNFNERLLVSLGFVKVNRTVF